MSGWESLVFPTCFTTVIVQLIHCKSEVFENVLSMYSTKKWLYFWLYRDQPRDKVWLLPLHTVWVAVEVDVAWGLA